MAGFADGLRAGTDAASRWIDIYNAGERRRANEAVLGAQPEFANDITSDQKRTVADAYLDSNDTAVARDGSDFIVKGPNGELPNRMVSRPTTTFLGQQTEGTMSPSQIAEARGMKLAELTSAYDPQAGANLYKTWTGERDSRIKLDKANALEQGVQDYSAQLSGMGADDLVAYANQMLGGSDGGYGSISKGADGQLVMKSMVSGLPDSPISLGQVKGALQQAYAAGNGNVAVGLESLVAKLGDAQKQYQGGLKLSSELESAGALRKFYGDRAQNTAARNDTAAYAAWARANGLGGAGARGGKAPINPYSPVELAKDPGVKAALASISALGLPPEQAQAQADAVIQAAVQKRRDTDLVGELAKAAKDGSETPSSAYSKMVAGNVPEAQALALVNRVGGSFAKWKPPVSDYNKAAPIAARKAQEAQAPTASGPAAPAPLDVLPGGPLYKQVPRFANQLPAGSGLRLLFGK